MSEIPLTVLSLEANEVAYHCYGGRENFFRVNIGSTLLHATYIDMEEILSSTVTMIPHWLQGSKQSKVFQT